MPTRMAQRTGVRLPAPPQASANEKVALELTKYPLPGRKSAGRRVFCCSDVESCPSWRVGGAFGREKAPNVEVRGRCGRARPGFGSGSGGGFGGWRVRAGVAVRVGDGSPPAWLAGARQARGPPSWKDGFGPQ